MLKKIWKKDIFPNWEDHWNYSQNQPKKFRHVRRIRTSESANLNQKHFFWSLWKCFKKDKIKKLDSTINCDFRVLDDNNEKNELKDICKNKSLLLVTLWKRGIPGWIRKTLWPISIGNRLEV